MCGTLQQPQPQPQQDRRQLQSHRYCRQLSFTEVERAVLSCLLIDTSTHTNTSVLSPSPSTAHTAPNAASADATTDAVTTITTKKSTFVSSSSSLTNQMLFTHPFLFDLEQRDTLDTIPYKEKDKYHIVTSTSTLSHYSLGNDEFGNDDFEEDRQPPEEIRTSDDHNDDINSDRETNERGIKQTQIETKRPPIMRPPRVSLNNDDMSGKGEKDTNQRLIETKRPPIMKPPRLSLINRPPLISRSRRTKTTNQFPQDKTAKVSTKNFAFNDETTEQETESSKLSAQSSSKKPGLLSSSPKTVQRSHTTGPGTNTSKKTNSIRNDLKINKPNPKNNAQLWAAHDEGKLSMIHITKKYGKASQSGSNDNDNEINLYVNNMKLREKMIDEHVKEGNNNSTKSGIFGIFAKGHRENMKNNRADCSLRGGIPFDCWQILRDECAPEYGFGAKEETFAFGALDLTKITGSADSRDTHTGTGSLLDSDSDDNDGDDDTALREFKILGTGPDDLSAQPHVLSPPLMDSLLNFVPEALSFENLWLKYSLVRDGSCLETFRHYTRASRNTILAIQTTAGDVFGSFTTSPWENQGLNCFGNGESFVWKMRLNRQEMTTQSLYTQAHYESEIDVYPYSGVNTTVQHCSQHMIAIGGTEIETLSPLGFKYQSYQSDSLGKTGLPQKISEDMFKYKTNEAGFAIALHDDLCRGTTSPCPTFCSPSLLTNGGEIFEVENLECWTFTPVDTVNEAQKLEMRKYFVARNTSRNSSNGSKSSFTSQDLIQGEFYRRLGDKGKQQSISKS